MGLFDKKYCDVCGDKIGLLGNRKLEDGNLCKNCAKKLSPWFSDRRSSTVAEIKAQLAYREENEKAVENFSTTRAIGSGTMVIIDENAGKFMVATQREATSENPDVLDFSQVVGCNMDVKEYNHEMTYTADDNSQRSYNPPRYEHTYDFFMVIKVNHPYFNEMRFRINDSSVVIRDQAVSADLFGNTFAASFDPSGNAEYSEYVRMGNEIINTLLKAHDSARAGASPAPGAPAHTPAAADPASAAVAAALAAVVCPYCGASTTPNERGCCKFCGGRLG